MSGAQVHAMGLLCLLLEQAKPQANGAALLEGELGLGGHELVRERLLAVGASLSYVTCPDCRIELARVVRPLSVDQVVLYCDECGEVDASNEISKTYTVSLSKLVDRLAGSLELPPSARKTIDADLTWRLGVQEHKRGKAQTWYFARHLNDHRVAHRLREQIRADQAAQSARIITSSDVPLPEGSPLAGFDVRNLAGIARLSQGRFLFFDDRVEGVASHPPEHAEPVTSLRRLRDQGWAYVEGVKYVLEPMQQKMLLVLMDAHAHRLEANELGERCGSDAFPFKPVKQFDRNKVVYKAFVKYVKADKCYELIVHPEDEGLL